MRGRGKAGTWCGRLLLFAALLLGIVTMHTLGHPTGGHGAPAEPTVQAQPHHATAPPPSPSPSHEHRPALDPMSVCLAVLGAGWTVVLLLALRLLRRPAGAAVVAAVRARFAHALRPQPPPPRHKALARLSVLRV
ncbi:hypothetical protein I5Q34_04050 [Streptomyces sp. AV19]|uniref:DUF6153 family protein n=1 Tax=Streptomyces sp. AV19 TaxID=2793068 RepID=UPI0018FE9FE1|nr:DUF6153 family protein [Streptomyces sp. AV19]MBH1933467.1 hypothetical protein [Streptomyces sp. AV19]MDG4532116.1 DUF6153 family protein [Streptomyces sp. AV19]